MSLIKIARLSRLSVDSVESTGFYEQNYKINVPVTSNMTGAFIINIL